MDPSFEAEVEEVEVLSEDMPGPKVTVDGLVKTQLDALLNALERKLDRDVISCIGPILFGVDGLVRSAVEALSRRRMRLAVVLDTAGGVEAMP